MEFGFTGSTFAAETLFQSSAGFSRQNLMLINIGGLWESPIVIADERSISWVVDSEINDYESERATLRSYNKEFYTASADHDVIDFIYFKSLTPEECDQEVMNLHCDAINSSGAFHENKLKTCYGYKDVKQIPPTKQSDKDLEKCKQDALRNLLSTKSERKKRDIKVHLDLNALRVRSSTTKDRHSKVNTAKGVRDRRVRLSVSTAIQLYNLQDKLGLQQPSKALDWLMTKAKSAIDELPVWKI